MKMLRILAVLSLVASFASNAGHADAAQKYVGVHYSTWFGSDYPWYKAWDPDSFTLGFEEGVYDWLPNQTAFGSVPLNIKHGNLSGWGGSHWGDSFAGGEEAVGSLRSRTFTLSGGTVTFKAAGYDGPNGTDNKNIYYLKRASDNAILFTAKPPQSDTFAAISWNAGAYAGTPAYFEAVDGNDGSAYAWLAVDDLTNGSTAFDFENGKYGFWRTEGGAFGSTPFGTAHGGLSGWQGSRWGDSFSGGETATGKLISKTFTLKGGEIRFLAAGWDGLSGTDNKNGYYLKRASDGVVLRSAKPPQSDSFNEVTWNVNEHSGVDVYIEADDSHTGTAYAWLAIDRVVYDVNPTTVTPAEGFYTSDDATVAARHAATLRDMGIDFIMMDETNNSNWGPEHPQAAFQTDTIYEDSLAVANAFATVPGAPKTVMMFSVTTWDSPYTRVQRDLTKNYDSGIPYMYYPWIPSNTGDLFKNKIGILYNDLAQYPAKYFHYEGKPLLLLYVAGGATVYDQNGTDQTPDGYMPASWNPVIPNTGGKTIRELFEIRWVSAFVAGSGNAKLVPSSGDMLKAYHGHWSYADDTPQSWASRNNAWGDTPEEIITSPNGGGGSTGRNNGLTYRVQWERVFDVDPVIATIASWNAFSTSGDEKDAEHSSSIEPTTNYFTDTYKIMTQNYIAHFKKKRMDIGLYDTTGKNMYLNNRDGTDYDGYSFDFGFESTYAMDRGNSVEALSGDFNGDGKSDFALRNKTDGTVAIRYSPYFTVESSGGMPAEKVVTLEAGSNDKAFAGDFNGDGKTDIGFYNATTGNFNIRYNDGNSNFTTSYTWAWSLSGSYQYASADVNGDGRYDIVYRDPAAGTINFALAKTDGLQTKPTSTYSFNWTAGSNYQLYTGEANGDAYGDIGLRDTISGKFYMLKNENTQTGSTWNFGDQKDYTYKVGSQYLPITGDFR